MYLSIDLVRLDMRTGYCIIIAGDEVLIEVYPNGNWRFIYELYLRGALNVPTGRVFTPLPSKIGNKLLSSSIKAKTPIALPLQSFISIYNRPRSLPLGSLGRNLRFSVGGCHVKA